MFSRISPIFFFAFLSVLFCGEVRAGKVELTTYYPAPSGEYQELKATGIDEDNTKIALQVSGSDTTTGFAVTNANNVGIGNLAPQTTLDISGTVRAVDTNTVCVAAANGALRYNTNITPNRYEYCDGKEASPRWKPLGGSGGVGWVQIHAGGIAGSWGVYWSDSGDHSPIKICQDAGYTSYTGACRYMYGTTPMQSVLSARKDTYWYITCLATAGSSVGFDFSATGEILCSE